MCRVLLAHFRWQGNQRRPVIQRCTISHMLNAQGKEVPAPQLYRAHLIDRESTLLTDLWLKLLIAEEIRHGLF